MIPNDTEAVCNSLVGLSGDESALYAITRDWRYDASGRKFERLHRLLGEHCSDIGIRLIRLAARRRELGCGYTTDHGGRAAKRREADADDKL